MTALLRGLLIGLVLLLVTLPLVHRYLPMPDWPQHLAQDAIVAHHNDRQFGSDLYYRSTGWFLPYQGFRLLHRGVMVLVPDVVLSGAVCLSLALLLGVGSIASISRTLGRSMWTVVACFTVLIESNFLWGFAPYVLATSVQWMQIALLLRWLHSEAKPGRWMLLLNALLGGALFFTHIQPAAISMVLQVALLFGAWRRGRIALRDGVLWAGSLLFCGALCSAYLLGSGWLSGANLSSDFPMHPQTVWHPVYRTVGWIPLASGLNALGWLPLAMYVVALIALIAQSRSVGDEAVASIGDRTAQLFQDQDARTMAVVLAVLALAMPAEFRGQSMGPRVTSALLLSVLWLWRPRRESDALKAILAGCALATLVYTHVRFEAFSSHVNVLRTMVQRVPLRARVASLVYQPLLVGYRLPVLLHLSAYFLAERGGMSSSGFTRTGVTYRPEVARDVLTVQQLWMPYTHGAQLTEQTHGMYYDAVFVVRGPRYPQTPFSDHHPRVHSSLLVRQGEFELWNITHDL